MEMYQFLRPLGNCSNSQKFPKQQSNFSFNRDSWSQQFFFEETNHGKDLVKLVHILSLLSICYIGRCFRYNLSWRRRRFVSFNITFRSQYSFFLNKIGSGKFLLRRQGWWRWCVCSLSIPEYWILTPYHVKDSHFLCRRTWLLLYLDADWRSRPTLKISLLDDAL